VKETPVWNSGKKNPCRIANCKTAGIYATFALGRFQRVRFQPVSAGALWPFFERGFSVAGCLG
jgi:hypothetical protein